MIPVVEALAGEVRVSIDTTKEAVADAAVDAGATLINDVSASLWPVAARRGVGWVAMHRQGTPATMQRGPHYDDVVEEVAALLVDRAARAASAGVDEVWIDPGIGFGKSVDHNLVPARRPRRPGGHRLPGAWWAPAARASSARWPGPDGEAPLPVGDRLPASLATATWAMEQGAGMVRVHDVAATVQAARLVGADRSGPGGEGQVGRGDPTAQLHLGHQGPTGHERAARAGSPPTTARCAGRRRSSGCRSRASPGWCRSCRPRTTCRPTRRSPWPACTSPSRPSGDARGVLGDLYRDLHGRLTGGERILIHQEELGDRVAGVVAGYLLWSDRLQSGPQSITVLEHMTGHPMGPSGRELVAFASQLAPAPVPPMTGDGPAGG